MDRLVLLTEGTMWKHILLGCDEFGMSILSKLKYSEIDKLLQILPIMAKIFNYPINIDSSDNFF
jgi:hypothetical protein